METRKMSSVVTLRPGLKHSSFIMNQSVSPLRVLAGVAGDQLRDPASHIVGRVGVQANAM